MPPCSTTSSWPFGKGQEKGEEKGAAPGGPGRLAFRNAPALQCGPSTFAGEPEVEPAALTHRVNHPVDGGASGEEWGHITSQGVQRAHVTEAPRS